MLEKEYFTLEVILYFEKKFCLNHDTLIEGSSFFFQLFKSNISYDSVLYMINQKADLNYLNQVRQSPLDILCFNAKYKPNILKLLLDNKASGLTNKDLSGKYPHQYLLEKMDRESMIILLSQQNLHFNIISKFPQLQDIIDSYNDDCLWNPNTNQFFPLQSQKIAFSFVLSTKSFSSTLRQLIPKPIIHLIIGKILGKDLCTPLLEL